MISTVNIAGNVLDGSGAASGEMLVRLVDSDGIPVTGTTDDGGTRQKLAGVIVQTIGAGGAISFGLCPNALITPAGTQYAVEYRLSDTAGERWWRREETWEVPDVAGPLDFADVLV